MTARPGLGWSRLRLGIRPSMRHPAGEGRRPALVVGMTDGCHLADPRVTGDDAGRSGRIRGPGTTSCGCWQQRRSVETGDRLARRSSPAGAGGWLIGVGRDPGLVVLGHSTLSPLPGAAGVLGVPFVSAARSQRVSEPAKARLGVERRRGAGEQFPAAPSTAGVELNERPTEVAGWTWVNL
jgi:hypothetical protein